MEADHLPRNKSSRWPSSFTFPQARFCRAEGPPESLRPLLCPAASRFSLRAGAIGTNGSVCGCAGANSPFFPNAHQSAPAMVRFLPQAMTVTPLLTEVHGREVVVKAHYILGTLVASVGLAWAVGGPLGWAGWVGKVQTMSASEPISVIPSTYDAYQRGGLSPDGG